MAFSIKDNSIHMEEAVDKTELKAAVAVDKRHHDEAMTVLASYSGPQTWDDKEEQRVRKKIDRRLLPILVICYGLQYYDKAMISQAALFGLRTDLDLTVNNRFSFASSIFYLGFICGAYPAIVMAQRFPIEKVAAGIILAWGICLICTPACHNWQGLFAQRFFLGFIEAGVSPMFMLVVGQFYKKNEQALRMG
jgi:MFS family permease